MSAAESKPASPEKIPIKVAVVEDDAGIRKRLTNLISGTDGFAFAGAFANAEQALKQIPLAWPNTVLMDINLPQMSGIECVARLKALRPKLLVIMLTVYADNEKIFKSLKAGATGYLLKQTPSEKIIEAILEVQQGGSPMSNSIARQVVEYFQDSPPADDVNNLSKRELEILTLLAKGYQYKEIADILSLSALTICAHVRNIYEKLQVHSRTEAVVKFLKKGESL
jgi:DNA-binding NarL/FixJ family response regulator